MPWSHLQAKCVHIHFGENYPLRYQRQKQNFKHIILLVIAEIYEEEALDNSSQYDEGVGFEMDQHNGIQYT